MVYAALKRILYLTESSPVYIAGSPENYFLKDCNASLSIVRDILQSNDEVLIDYLQVVNDDELLPRRVTLLYVLAYALTQIDAHKTVETRTKLASLAVEICRDDEEFFRFISIFVKINSVTKKNKITTAIGSAVKKYFDKKTPLEYAVSVAKAKGYYGWRFKDLIKLSHYKSKCEEKELITAFTLFGEHKLDAFDAERMKDILTYLKKWDTLRRTENEEEAVALVAELEPDPFQVNTKLFRSMEIWSHTIQKLTAKEILPLLPKLYKYDLLKSNSKVHERILEVLGVEHKMPDSDLNPIEIFIHMKNFEKGGKPKDPKLQEYLTKKKESEDKEIIKEKPHSDVKCNVLMTAIRKCLNSSYAKNPFKLNRKIILAIENLPQEAFCFKNKNISCLEAEIALVLHFMRSEKSTCAMYQNDNVKMIKLEDGEKHSKLPAKIENMKSQSVKIESVFDWAINKNIHAELFISVIQTIESLYIKNYVSSGKENKPMETSPANTPQKMVTGESIIGDIDRDVEVVEVPKIKHTIFPWKQVKEGLDKYREKMASPSTKLVIICLGSHPFENYKEIDDALIIFGLCPEIPQLIKAYVERKFT